MFLGIDLGTTNSLISYWISTGNGTFDVRILKNSQGFPIIPSAVYFEEETDEIIVGKEAISNVKEFPDRVIRWVKRNMGENKTYIVGKNEFSPQLISGFIIKELKDIAEKDNGGVKIENIAISVPADFDENAKQATEDAAKIAGFKNVYLIPEPNAAILSYIFRSKEIGKFEDLLNNKNNYFLIFDLGGGTFDLSLSCVTLSKNKTPNIEVISSHGNKYIGGYNFDVDLLIYVLEKMRQIYPSEIELLNEYINKTKKYFLFQERYDEESERILNTIIDECEHNKESLTREAKKKFTFYINSKAFRAEIHRKEFDLLIEKYLLQFEECSEQILVDFSKKLGITINDFNLINKVVMVGGSSAVPRIKEWCLEKFGDKLIDGIYPFEAITMGAAIYSAIRQGEKLFGEYKQVIPHSYGVIINNNFVPVLHRGSFDKNTTYNYRVPFSLDTKAEIKIAQQHHDINGNIKNIDIKKINYHHPFLFTGDTLNINFEMNDSLLLKVTISENCINDSVELDIFDKIKMSDKQIEENKNIIIGVKNV